MARENEKSIRECAELTDRVPQMKKTFVRTLSQPKLVDPVIVVGLPSIGDVGRMAAKLFRDFLKAEPFAELYSPLLPDYVFIDKKGVCRPPKYEFYVSPNSPSLVILMGDSQPALEDIPAHYELCSDILDYVSELGCKSIITMDGAPTTNPTKEIYVAATDKDLAAEYASKGAVAYKRRRIIGMSGLLLGLAKKRGLKGACILGSTSGFTADRESAFRVYRFLRKVILPDSKEST
jgi:proteasome assembly chaperone (PAC2) family protein